MRAQRGFFEDAVLLLRLAVGVVAVLAIWWFKSSYDDSVRAPIERERDEARAEAQGERQAKEWLNKVLVDQAARERKTDIKVEGIARDLNALKFQSPAARDWADTRIPDDVIGVSRYAAPSPVLRDPGGGKKPGAGADRPAAGRHESGPAEPEKPVLGSAGQGESTTQRPGYLRQAWDRLTGKVKGVTP